VTNIYILSEIKSLKRILFILYNIICGILNIPKLSYEKLHDVNIIFVSYILHELYTTYDYNMNILIDRSIRCDFKLLLNLNRPFFDTKIGRLQIMIIKYY